MTETLTERIIRHEGIRLKPYRDSEGNLTIGIGRCLDTKGISEEEAIEMFSTDIADAQDALYSALPWAARLDEERHDILIEMVFQLGIAGLLEFQHMLADIQTENWQDAKAQMLDSKWHAQSPARCEELAEIMLTGIINT